MSRPPSIPKSLHMEVFRLSEQGLGYRRVTQAFENLGCRTTKSSVYRLLRGHPPYHRTL